MITEVETLDLISQLGQETVVEYLAESETVETIVDDLLALQGLTPAITKGTISNSIKDLTRSIQIDGDSILRALYRLRDTVGGYIEVDSDRQLNWLDSIGEDKGQQIRYRKNLKGIERDIDYTKLANRIYAYGEGEGDARIKLSDAEGQEEDYIEDDASQTEWGGIYPAVIVDKSITHPDTLLAWAQLKLAERKDPPISYRIDTVDLSQSDEFDFSFEALQLGSTVKVIDEDLGIDVETTVVSIEHPDLLKPQEMTIELSTLTRDISDTLAEVYDLQQLGQHIAIKIGAGQVIVKGTFTVLDWATGGETTIDGSNIQTGTITAEMLNFSPVDADEIIATINASTEELTIQADKISISRMDCMLEDIKWTYDKGTNQLDWTAGEIIYMDAGTKYRKSISSGNTTWSSGVKYIYYVKGATAFSNTTDYETAIGDDNILLATYEGGAKLNVLIGRTTIEGGDIYANSITANQIAVGTITADEIAVGTITGNKIAADTISASKLTFDAFNKDTDNLDDIDDGSTWGRIRIGCTDGNGYLELNSLTKIDGEWYDESGVEINANSGINIYGTNNALTTRASKTGTIQCYVGADGAIYAGGGDVVLDHNGIKIFGETLKFCYGADNAGYLRASSSALKLWSISGYDLEINAGDDLRLGANDAVQIIADYLILGSNCPYMVLPMKTSPQGSPPDGCTIFNPNTGYTNVYSVHDGDWHHFNRDAGWA